MLIAALSGCTYGAVQIRYSLANFVCIPAEATLFALEPGLGKPIGIVHVVALGTGFGGIIGRNEDDWNACQLRLVDDKTDQLSIRPGEPFASLAFLNLYPFTDALKVFKDDSGVCAFSLLDNSTRNQMVVVADNAGFSIPEFAHSSAGGLGVVALKTSAQFKGVAAFCPDAISREAEGLTSIGGGGYGSDPTVHSHKVGGQNRIPFGNLDGLVEIPFLANALEIGLTLDVGEERGAFLSCLKVDPDTFV
jgi:hypothetical protein